MKAIVFGGSGFLGSHVADTLTEQGHDVTIYDTARSKYLHGSQKMVTGDIMDEKLVERTVQGADVVYNFAGISDIEESSHRPLDAVKFNILGNTIILDSCCKAKVKRFVFASSVYVYSKTGSFYRSTKQACELLIENYSEVYGLQFTILRYGSLYGPRAGEDTFMYRMLKQALTEKKITREGDGEEIREYIHVYDAARCSVEILSEEFAGQYVIITGNQQMKVKDLLLMINEMLGNSIAIEYIAPKNNFHYEITPYTFTPKIAKRYISKTYLDLGQGILKSMQGIYEGLK
ncbi:MAG: NAD(P)-dependent oxidoreductase [Candidatus Omnitrophica bacterium]|nr:NAD(P)-dependent oxidoreductase [Candidatus Omnitrophota bacterium]